jgi:hypothetical protein
MQRKRNSLLVTEAQASEVEQIDLGQLDTEEIVPGQSSHAKRKEWLAETLGVPWCLRLFEEHVAHDVEWSVDPDLQTSLLGLCMTKELLPHTEISTILKSTGSEEDAIFFPHVHMPLNFHWGVLAEAEALSKLELEHRIANILAVSWQVVQEVH